MRVQTRAQGSLYCLLGGGSRPYNPPPGWSQDLHHLGQGGPQTGAGNTFGNSTLKRGPQGQPFTQTQASVPAPPLLPTPWAVPCVPQTLYLGHHQLQSLGQSNTVPISQVKTRRLEGGGFSTATGLSGSGPGLPSRPATSEIHSVHTRGPASLGPCRACSYSLHLRAPLGAHRLL